MNTQDELANALEEAMEVMVGCVVPAGGCDDAKQLADAIKRGADALVAVGRQRKVVIGSAEHRDMERVLAQKAAK